MSLKLMFMNTISVVFEIHRYLHSKCLQLFKWNFIFILFHLKKLFSNQVLKL